MRTGKKLILDNIWKYVLVAAVVLFAWIGVYENLSQIKGNQRVTVAVYNIECDTQRLWDDLWAKLPELTQQEILELYVDDLNHIPHQTYATDILVAQVLQADLVIMPESLLKELDISVYFPKVPESLQGTDGYLWDGVQYGIRIVGNSVFTAYCTEVEPFYLFLNKNSANLARAFDKGEAEDNAGIKILEYLLKEVAQ